ncbi:restriction endonuclease subunit S [uncultured Streptococcus sp.]|uniref:restriction endonuclease subunit S n=1 Tax=uncultured Streptococcus sp. TaxID=83427 RepID=UPI0026651396|nr:restriction endonuclease subunit S [uncultured Streptococcus sp.]
MKTNGIPKIRFKGFTDDWEQRKLGDVFDERSERASGNEELLSVTISNGVIRQIDSEKRNIASEDKSNYKVVKKGDVPYNSMRMWQGAVGTSDYDGIVSPAYTVLIPKNNCNGKFFMELFKKQPTLENFKRWSQGLTSDTWNLKYPVLSTIPFMVPSVKEQEKIAEYFKSLDNLITLHQRKCEQTKELKKFMLQKMFPKKGEKNPEIRFPGFTDDWEQRKLIDYLEVSKEKNKNEVFGKEDVLSVSGDYGIVNQIEFQGRSFAGASVAPYGIVDTGDIVYTKSPLKSNPYGIIKANKGKAGIVSTLYAVYKPLDNVCSDFVQIYFEQDARMNNYMHPLVNKGAKNDMKVSDVNALKGEVCFPSKDEQIKISEHFANLDRLITLHQRKCEQLKELKKFMLQNMFPKKG